MTKNFKKLKYTEGEQIKLIFLTAATLIINVLLNQLVILPFSLYLPHIIHLAE
jgi:hypothetical protein